MADEIFVDGVLGVGFSQGAMRIDFYTVSNVSQPSKKSVLRLIMTKEGFVETYGQFTEVIQQLHKISASPDSQPDDTPEGKAGVSPKETISPNF